MNRLTLFGLLLFGLLEVWADNTRAVVEQVNSAVTLSGNTDYHITSVTPFTATGSINITNTQHAVVIFDKLKPSVALGQLGFISIKGQPAVLNRNCQIRIHDGGALLLPYGADKLLTIYSEINQKGDSCSDFGLEHTNGFMNTLTAKKLNNRVKSFKLKRGYMVTLSNLPGGFGYSRCFIADKNDLLVNLPEVMAGKVSSYRLFKWQDVSKKGLANDTRSVSNNALNTTWCYSFGLGEDAGIDRECVPHHIHEAWPAINDCGSVTYSPHLKTNNEPGNKADDKPATVAEVLANWEKLMATGMRLASPSSHDGSLGWLKEFMDSADARGYRVDILDVHSYWYYTNWEGNMKNNFFLRYKRPIWVSEYLWGASWSNNWYNGDRSGSAANYQKTLNAMRPILTYMNGAEYIERYAYWNSEADCSKIYNTRDASLAAKNYLTPTGEYYAAMETGVGYNSKYDYVPTAPRLYAPNNLKLTFIPSTMVVTLNWRERNGELTSAMIVERKSNQDGAWEELARLKVSEQAANYTLKDTLKTSGYYSYRVRVETYDGRNLYSTEVYNIIDGTEMSSNAHGSNPDIQYGSLTAETGELAYSYFRAPFTAEPAIVFGSPTFRNANLYPVEHVQNILQLNSKYAFMRYHYMTLAKGTTQVFSNGAETSNLIVAKPGNGTIGSLAYEAGYINGGNFIGADTVSVIFAVPFPQAPVVLATPIYSSVEYPCMGRVFNVTPRGFKYIVQRQQYLDDENAPRTQPKVAFFAIEKGRAVDGYGKMFTVGDTLLSTTSATASPQIRFNRNLKSVKFLAQMQTMNRAFAGMVRIQPVIPQTTDNVRIRFNSDPSNTSFKHTLQSPIRERVGWIAISEDTDITNDIVKAYADATARKVTIYPSVAHETVGIKDMLATEVSLFSLNGIKVLSVSLINGQVTLHIGSLPSGVYLVRTDAGNTAKMIKKR